MAKYQAKRTAMSKISKSSEEQKPAANISVTNKFGNEKSAFDLDDKK